MPGSENVPLEAGSGLGESDLLAATRERVLSASLWAGVVFGLVAYVAGVGVAVRLAAWEIVVFNTAALATMVALAVGRRYRPRAFGLCACVYAIGVYFTWLYGPLSAGPLWLVATPVVVALLFGLRPAVVALLAVALTVSVVAVALSRGWLKWSGGADQAIWLVISGSVVAVSGLLSLSLGALLDGLEVLHDELEQANDERRRVEEQLRQAQKMEAVGLLAGGIAHDFNNCLTAISNFTDFAIDDLDDRDRALEDLEQVARASERAGTLTRQLLAFARRRPVRPVIVDLPRLVEETLPMLRRLLGETVVVEVVSEGVECFVRADPGALEQVLVNLAVNARDAMPGGGRLTIGTGLAVRESEKRAQGTVTAEDESDPWVFLRVTDEGIGMDEETRRRAFEPFFTTKALGKGTGLGLATCWGIVEQAGGFVEVDSHPDRGTTVEVFLPREAAGSSESEVAEEELCRRGTERILLVEDDDQVRASASRVLRSHGYQVVEAADSATALRLSESVDLLLTDVILPGLSGPRLARRMAESNPGLRVLFISGYTANELAQQEIDEGVALLEKPFTSARLATRVRAVLDSSEAHREGDPAP